MKFPKFKEQLRGGGDLRNTRYFSTFSCNLKIFFRGPEEDHENGREKLQKPFCLIYRKLFYYNCYSYKIFYCKYDEGIFFLPLYQCNKKTEVPKFYNLLTMFQNMLRTPIRHLHKTFFI